MKKENIICGIYKITSPPKRIYVGQSEDVERRKKQYSKLKNCKTQIRLYNSLKKHGWSNHKFEIIHLCKEEQLNDLETYYIKLFDTFNTPHGLNLTKGGGGTSGYKHTKESNEKNRQSKLGKTYEEMYGIEKAKEIKKEKSESMKDKMVGKNNPMYGKKQSKESNKKRSESLKGKMTGKNHPMFGKIGYRKGKTWEEIFGIEKANKMKKDLREANSGKNNPNYGKVSPMKGKVSPLKGRKYSNGYKKKKLTKVA